MIIALAGGVGGAKLANGLAAILPPGQLLIVVNTGDDFEHLGLAISPDIDTVMYTLAGCASPEHGWGLAGETWSFMAALERVGGETWFRLGDRDLATHVERTRRLANGQTLSEVTEHLCARYGVKHRIAPMTDAIVRTFVETREGTLAFQEYFVRRHCEPDVLGVEFRGSSSARMSVAFARAIESADLEAVVLCPSNPLLSIGPILAIAGVRERLSALRVPRIAVSPLIQGRAVKGPAAKMMRELGLEPSPVSVAEMYAGVADAMLIDESDSVHVGPLRKMGIAAIATPTLMKNSSDQVRLARAVLQMATSMRASVPIA